MKRLIIICLILLIQNKTIGQNQKLISDSILENQNSERIDSIAKTLDYKKKIVRVYTMFTVDENGHIQNVVVRGPHRLFEQEAIRLINLVPKLDITEYVDGGEGKKFSLPIYFKIETKKEKLKKRKKEEKLRKKMKNEKD